MNIKFTDYELLIQQKAVLPSRLLCIWRGGKKPTVSSDHTSRSGVCIFSSQYYPTGWDTLCGEVPAIYLAKYFSLVTCEATLTAEWSVVIVCRTGGSQPLHVRVARAERGWMWVGVGGWRVGELTRSRSLARLSPAARTCGLWAERSFWNLLIMRPMLHTASTAISANFTPLPELIPRVLKKLYWIAI